MAFQSYDPILGSTHKSVFEFIEPLCMISASVSDEDCAAMSASQMFMPRPMPESVMKLLRQASEENRMNGVQPFEP